MTPQKFWPVVNSTGSTVEELVQKIASFFGSLVWLRIPLPPIVRSPATKSSSEPVGVMVMRPAPAMARSPLTISFMG